MEDELACARVAEALIDSGFTADAPTLEAVRRWAGVPVEECAKGRSAAFLRESGQERDIDFVLDRVDDLDEVYVMRDRELVRKSRGDYCGHLHARGRAQCVPYTWHSGTIGVIRSLGRLGVPVYLSGESASSPAGRSRYLSGVLHETPVTQADQLVDRLRSLPLPKPPVLIPMDDVGSIFLDRHGDELTGQSLFPRPPPGLATGLADKQRLAALASLRPSPVRRPSSYAIMPSSRRSRSGGASLSFSRPPIPICWRRPPGCEASGWRTIKATSTMWHEHFSIRRIFCCSSTCPVTAHRYGW